MCGKCHDLNNVVSNASWNQHGFHINTGFTCSVCHTAHGMGARSGTISGERLVNFDINVVAPNGSIPISYTRATNTCVLVCHMPLTTPTVRSRKAPRRATGPNSWGDSSEEALILAADFHQYRTAMSTNSHCARSSCPQRASAA